MIEARADEAMITTYRHLLKDDEAFGHRLGQAATRPVFWRHAGDDHSNLGFRAGKTRCRFGKFLRVAVTTGGRGHSPEDVAGMLKEHFPLKDVTEEGEKVHGMPVRLAVSCQSPRGAASTSLLLGEQARFYPSDALAAWRVQAVNGKSEIVLSEIRL